MQRSAAHGRGLSVGVSEGPLPAADIRNTFEEFVRGRSTHLFRLALALSGWDEAVAHDLLQIALERAYRRRWRLFGEDAAAEPYVRRVLVNAAIDWRRGLRRRDEQPLAAMSASLLVEDDTAQVVDRDLLVRAMKNLPPKQRAVLVLRYWEDLPDSQIAATLGCSRATVRSQASRALARLRQLAAASSAHEV
jgi:RNA polymerase sigma-70 factor (sigma-E family)